MSDILRLETTEVAEFTAMQWGLNLQAAYERIAELSNAEAEENYRKLNAVAYNFHNVVQTIVTPDTWEKIKESFDYEGYYDCL